MQRTLRSKHLRAVLWIDAKGKCKLCNKELDPDNWHADHIIPWSKTHRTNVHEMQALCPGCNLKKGDKSMVQLRSHQAQFLRLMERVATNDEEFKLTKKIIVSVTPGGGKSLLPIITAKKLIDANKIDRVCWVCPRRSLQVQGEREFLKKVWREYFHHDLLIMKSTNEINPCRGTAGYITTYQALGQDSAGLNAAAFEQHRYALILDEPHHLDDEGCWKKRVEPLRQRCKYLILMSGTFDRNNRKPIAYIDYKKGLIDLDPTETTAVIKYTRQDALREKTILRTNFYHHDGSAEWINREGDQQSTESLSDVDRRNAGAALHTALQTDYADSLLMKGLSHWRKHKASHKSSKLLIVAAYVKDARRFQKLILQVGEKSKIAVSEDGPKAVKAIENFKKNQDGSKVDILVTVAMAYEGLDVPGISHIICLTHIRNKPWVEQMLARATRIDPKDGNWEGQTAHVFVPDDLLMNGVIENIKVDQAIALCEMQLEDESSGGDEGGEEGEEYREIIPIGSAYTRERHSELDGDEMSYEETMAIQQKLEELNICCTPLQAKIMIEAFNGRIEALDIDSSTEGKTPSEKRAILRTTIQKHCNTRDVQNGGEFGDTNRKLYKVFGEKRENMSVEELSRVWGYLQREFPIRRNNENLAAR